MAHLLLQTSNRTSLNSQKADVSGGPAATPFNGTLVFPSLPSFRWRPSRPSARRCASANDAGGNGGHAARLLRPLRASSVTSAACSWALPWSRLAKLDCCAASSASPMPGVRKPWKIQRYISLDLLLWH